MAVFGTKQLKAANSFVFQLASDSYKEQCQKPPESNGYLLDMSLSDMSLLDMNEAE